MPVMDEFQEEREALKQASIWEKIKYFVYYYKWHTVAAIAVLIIGFTWIRDVVTSKDAAFYAAIVNGAALNNAEEFNLAFTAYSGIDNQKYDVIFDTSMQLVSGSGDQMSVASSQKLVAYSSIGELDILCANQSLFTDYANSTFFYDLREILTPEQMEQCKPYLYYVDRPVVEAMEEAEPTFDNPTPIEVPDPSKPELMEDPIPVGLFANDLKTLTDYYYLGPEDAALGIPINTKNLDNAIKFLTFITR
ncbi:MAG: hypothetical protein IJ833_01365 [Lachnospiraceae bacterium]|nr:hypothetical protein [Lachnospiraceae bacterium]